MPTKTTFARLFTTFLALCLSQPCRAQVSDDDLLRHGMWRAPFTDLIWSRCRVGASWNGTECVGTPWTPPKTFTSAEPTNAGQELLKAVISVGVGGNTDWRLPTIEELQALLRCSDGQVVPEGAGEKFFFACGDGGTPQLNSDIFPGATEYKPQPVDRTEAAASACGGACSLKWLLPYIGGTGALAWNGSTSILVVRSDSLSPQWASLVKRQLGTTIASAPAPRTKGVCRDNRDGTFTGIDGSLWHTCALGQSYEGNRCNGSASELNIAQAVRAARANRLQDRKDWALPRFDQLVSAFNHKSCSHPVIEVYTGSMYVELNRGVIWSVHVNDETMKIATHTVSGGIRTRPLELTGTDVNQYGGPASIKTLLIAAETAEASESMRKAEVVTERLLKRVAEQNRQAAVEADQAQRARDQEERRFGSLLGSKDPQSMYIAAGQYIRSGESSKGRNLLERIVEKFPRSNWAVKASDQLLQEGRVDSLNSESRRATSELKEKAVQACRLEVDRCYSRGGKNCYQDCSTLR